MKVFLIIVPLLRFLVLFLLLYCTGMLCDSYLSVWRLIIAASFGGIYTLLCMINHLHFLGNTCLYYTVLCCISVLAFTFRKKLVFTFILLNLVLDGITGNGHGNISMFAGIIGFLGLMYLKTNKALLIPVVLTHNGKTVNILALKDTGNTLSDPLTGQPILVVSANVAMELTGLTKTQIHNPIDSISVIPGLRLIPYKTVGCKSDFMLGLKIQEVRIGEWKGSRVIAFAPEGLGESETYQALAGGSL